MNKRQKSLRIILACSIVLCVGLFLHLQKNSTYTQNIIPQQNTLCGLQPLKETSALATENQTISIPQLANQRTQQQFQQQTQSKHRILHGLRPKYTAKPRQANKTTTTFCRKNSCSVEYFIYFLQEIII